MDPDSTIIDGSDLFRVFNVEAGDSESIMIMIKELTVHNGSSGVSAAFMKSQLCYLLIGG